jgi:hypothetical protein
VLVDERAGALNQARPEARLIVVALPGRCGVPPAEGVTENGPRLGREPIAGRGRLSPPVKKRHPQVGSDDAP